MSERPDYIHCVLRPGERPVGWCGAPISGFFFTDIEHAIFAGEQGGRLLMCQDCETAICVSLRTASSGAKPVDVERMDELALIETGADPVRRLTPDERVELAELRRRFEARYREPSTLPPEVRGETDRVLARKREGASRPAAERTLSEVLEAISDELREKHGELYDGQLGISTRGFKLLEAAWNSHRRPS